MESPHFAIVPLSHFAKFSFVLLCPPRITNKVNEVFSAVFSARFILVEMKFHILLEEMRCVKERKVWIQKFSLFNGFINVSRGSTNPHIESQLSSTAAVCGGEFDPISDLIFILYHFQWEIN